MKLAILFWFYKEPEVCKNHLLMLKKNNPDLLVYGLFGGNPKETGKYKKLLGPFLDDFYSTTMLGDGRYRTPKNKKWITGELMLLEWYKNRGVNLKWDSLAIVQWDLLILGSIKSLFKGMKKNEIYISGTRNFAPIHAKKWWWTMNNTPEGKDFPTFLKYVKREFGFTATPLVCLFMFQIFPRKFWEKFAQVKRPDIGMLEYKMPTYAKIFKIPFFKKDLGVYWFQDNKRNSPMNAESVYISDQYIQQEIKKKNGWRIFHPYTKQWFPG